MDEEELGYHGDASEKARLRAKLEADVEAYLAAGGTITVDSPNATAIEYRYSNNKLRQITHKKPLGLTICKK